MNEVIMMGRLTRDPEIRCSGDIVVARFSLAVDRRFKKEGQATTDFFNCSAFGKLAKFAEDYLHKGSKMLIRGRLQNDNYTDKNGNKVYGNQIVIESMEFAESKNASGNAQAQPKSAEPKPDSDGFMNIPEGIDEELPFT